ncbi:hypothetical protein IWX49DRAFT_549395 [Phyllosticta citricarpa]
MWAEDAVAVAVAIGVGLHYLVPASWSLAEPASEWVRLAPRVCLNMVRTALATIQQTENPLDREPEIWTARCERSKETRARLSFLIVVVPSIAMRDFVSIRPLLKRSRHDECTWIEGQREFD